MTSDSPTGPSRQPAPLDRAVPDGFASAHADAIRLLRAWSPEDAGQQDLTQRFLEQLAHGPAALWREGPPRHLTASAVVLDQAGERTLLTLHRKAGMWCQFGGHFEAGDQDVQAAATREAREESGMPTLELAPGLAELSAHDLSRRFGRCRTHLDLRFAGIAPAGVRPAVSDESIDVAWWPVAALPPAASPDLPDLIDAARRHLGLQPA